MFPDLDVPDVTPTVGFRVLCGFTVWSAVKYYGSADGAVMLHITDMKHLRDEFEMQMAELAKRDAGFFAVRYPSRWILRWYLPQG